MLDPSGRTYVEDFFEFQQPAPLAPLFETAAAGLAGDTRFVAALIGEQLEQGEFTVHYDSAEPDAAQPGSFVLQGLREEREQSFQLRRLQSASLPNQGTAWISVPFDYELHARVETPVGPANLFFETVGTEVVLQFSDDLSRVVAGTLSGVLEHERAKTLPLEIPCLLACPIECGAAVLSTVLDALECNDLKPDVDLDPATPGNEGYTVEVAFTAVETSVRTP